MKSHLKWPLYLSQRWHLSFLHFFRSAQGACVRLKREEKLPRAHGPNSLVFSSPWRTSSPHSTLWKWLSSPFLPPKPHHFPQYILFTCLQNQSKTTCPHTAYRNVKIRAPNNREDIQHVVLLSCHESDLPPQKHFFRHDTTSQLDLSSNFQVQTISAQPASALHSSSSSGRVFWPLEQCTDSQISEACIY